MNFPFLRKHSAKLLLPLVGLLLTASAYPQEISFSEKNASLNKVFNIIRQQTNFDFFYKGNAINNIKVTATVKNATIDQVMSLILKDQPFTYELADKTVIIRPKQVNTEKEKPVMMAPAADSTIKGLVTDKKGEPLAGVTIRLKGAATATVTGPDGVYAIDIPAGNGVLEFSYIGFVTQAIPVNRRAVINVQLINEDRSMGEIVIVGYGEVARKDLTGSVSTIKSEAFENVPIVTIDQMLQGKAPGMQVSSISGQPGDGTTIRIRGGNSVSAVNEPLYVVDGIIAGDDFNPNLLNPDDVHSIDILKDASSTAIYGARGSNGVILITTKRGKSGKDKIVLNAYTGYQELPQFIDMMNGPEYAQLVNDQLVSEGKPIFYSNVDSVPSTDWQREVTHKARQSNLSVQISGGDQKSNYLLSANYSNQEGIILNSGFKRYQFRANLTRQVNKMLEVNSTFNVANSLTDNNPVSLGGLDYYSSALGVAPTMPVYKPDGTFALKREYSSGNLNHPLAQALLITNPIKRTNLLGNVTINFKPVDGLTIKSSFGSQLNFIKNNRYESGQLPVAKVNNSGGAARVSSSQEIMYLIENTISYNKQFHQHNLNALAGMTYQSASTESLNAGGSKYPTDVMEYNNLNGTDQTTFTIGSDLTDYAIVSYLARVNYGFKSKYLLTLTGRVDGSSRFAVNNKYAFFPAIAFAWRAIEEPFFRNITVLSNLKVRASYGRVGNQAIPSYGSLSTLGQARYIFGANSNTLGYIQGNYGNPDLRWETTGQYDMGIEVGLFKNRLSVEVDLYTKRTNDLLNNKQLPEQTGYSSLRTNIGAIRNTGIELSVNSVNIRNKQFSWSTSFNIATNKNKVLDLGGVDYILTQNITYAGNVSRLTLGDPVGTFWGATYYGTRKTLDKVPGAVGVTATPKLGEALYVDTKEDGVLSVDDYGVIGNSNPDLFGGFSNTFTYGRFNLNFYMSFSYGNQIMNIADAFYNTGDLLSNQYKTLVNRWSPQNPDSEIPTFSRNGYIPNTRWVYDGSYLRMKSFTLGYNLPGRAIRAKWIQNVNLYVSASNLFVLTSYPYYDPESNAYGKSNTVRGFDATNYPQSRAYVGGVKIDL
jgi:TonB-linked SusC/RagA family outer membrane protein